MSKRNFSNKSYLKSKKTSNQDINVSNQQLSYKNLSVNRPSNKSYVRQQTASNLNTESSIQQTQHPTIYQSNKAGISVFQNEISALDYGTSQLETNTYVFTLNEMRTIQKPIKSFVYYAKLVFLSFQSFNLIYLGTVFYFMFNFMQLNKDFRVLLYGEFGLGIILIIFNIRIFKSLYGIYAVLFARSRRPLYLYLLFNYFVSFLYILCGLFVLFTPIINSRFHTILENHIKGLTTHYNKEKPTWYLIENVQFYGQCCGYHSFIDILKIYKNQQQSDDLFKPTYYLPLTCCSNAIRGDICTIYKEDLILKGCAKFLHLEIMNNINLPILLLLFCDVFSLIFIVYLMRRFKDNLVRIEIKEDLKLYLDREENRLINELLNNKIIRDFEKDKIKDKYRKIIKLEQSINLRPTMEGLILVIRKEGNQIELRSLNPSLFKIGAALNKYDYLESQFKTGFIDLFKNEEDDKKQMIDKLMIPTKIKQQNTLLMAGGEKINEEDAQKNLEEFGLEKKIFPWNAIRTRNAILIINKKQDKIKNLKKHGLGPVIRFNSLDTRVDKQTIEDELRKLKMKGEEGNTLIDLKSKIIASRIDANDEENMSIRILRKTSYIKPSSIRKSNVSKKSINRSNQSDIIEDKLGSDEDVWNDIKKNR